ncbi:molybdenum cofactor guanylyltransferase MobA [Hydrogenophaga sp. PAMC20947]|uniref:molybdenum cofactor guanylyltransferase MobA n=1 Tax=Hydrogenophaga sp. PAMC20947 TaxID=2565558 RepID=UPI00109DBA87|nr:molybdenum cofactor guanylyltransferase MobA [Hydrogenophaga sp. PAMC20947]QCB45633.1 molybdenum cofactor guanylyltransferase [Hydrogenophaga sp. PAMC20947]
MTALLAGSITALVLAGGRATRMGGVDKGLQLLNGTPLALHAIQRLQIAPNPLLAACAINANRHLASYAQWGFDVWPDTVPDQPGPLAGMLTGLRHSKTSHLLTVPCDAPCFPPDLVARLAVAFEQPGVDIAVASARDEAGILRRQPVFALMQVKLADRLEAYIQGGGRKVGHWMSEQQVLEVAFNRPDDDPAAFVNLNTLDSLRSLAAHSDTLSP